MDLAAHCRAHGSVHLAARACALRSLPLAPGARPALAIRLQMRPRDP